MFRRTLAGSCALLGAAAAATAFAVPAWAAPPSSGCPSNWSRLSVAELTDKGYRLPAQVDSPDQRLSFGHEPGNGNGWVCGVADAIYEVHEG